MKEGLIRVAKWATAVAVVLGSAAAICYWGFGVSGKQVDGSRTMTITEALTLMAGAAAVVSMYCLVHANDDDTPTYN